MDLPPMSPEARALRNRWRGASLALAILNDERPAHLRVADALRSQIIADLPPGAPLPSLRELAYANRCNPDVVRRAYAVLERDGLIVMHARRGAFVADPTAKAKARERITRDTLQPALAALPRDVFRLIDVRAAIDAALSYSMTTNPTTFGCLTDLVRFKTIHEVSDALATATIVIDGDDSLDHYARGATAELFAALILHMYWCNQDDPGTISSVHLLVRSLIGDSPAATRASLMALGSTHHDPQMTQQWRNHRGEPTPTHPFILFALSRTTPATALELDNVLRRFLTITEP